MFEADNESTPWDEARYSEFVAECYRYLNAAQDRAKEEFRLGSYQRFDWDHVEGGSKWRRGAAEFGGAG